MWALAWAVIQLAFAPALSLIDGAYAKRNANLVVAHAEGHSTKSCQPPHSADCAICQFVSSHAARASSAPTFDWSTTPLRCGSERTSVVAQSPSFDLPDSRAPPIA